jgi:uncharacterized membrane protein
MDLTDIIETVTELIGATIPIALALALLAFMWGVFQAFGKTDNVEGRSEARQAIFWSLIAIVVVVSLAGIIAIFTATFPDLQP